MKSFLLKNKSPVVKWGQIPDNYFFEGEIPEGYSLAVCPNNPYVILDIDVRNNISGFDAIPRHILNEIENSLNYFTKNNGKHYWLEYTGNKQLMNRSTKFGIDLRTEKGYVKWYLDCDIRDCISKINKTSSNLNRWLEDLFS